MLYIVVAFSFLAVGFTLWREGRNKSRQFKARAVPWERTRAVVTGISPQFIGKGRAFCPMYRYTYGDREYHWTSAVGEREGTHKVGETITILVNPLNPAESAVAVDIKVGSRTVPVADFITGRSLEGMALLALAFLAFAAAALFALLALRNWP